MCVVATLHLIIHLARTLILSQNWIVSVIELPSRNISRTIICKDPSKNFWLAYHPLYIHCKVGVRINEFDNIPTNVSVCCYCKTFKIFRSVDFLLVFFSCAQHADSRPSVQYVVLSSSTSPTWSTGSQSTLGNRYLSSAG